MAKTKRTVHEPHVTLRGTTPNQSSRNGTRIDLIVLHDTESHDRAGNSDLAGLISWFANPAAQVSIHAIVDAEGKLARIVSDENKAWHCVDFNSRSLGIEQVGFATLSKTFWNKQHRAQLVKVARLIAYWSKIHNIPIRDARRGGAGITTHAALGAAGGGHHDPGVNYPFATVLRLAQFYRRRGWPVK